MNRLADQSRPSRSPAHGADVFAVKIAQCGGCFNALRVAAIADAAGIGLYGGTMLEGAVATIALAHAFATFARLDWAQNCSARC